MKTTYMGNEALLQKNKIAFLSSRFYSDALIPEVEEWIESLSKEECVVCNHHSLLEKQVLCKLMEKELPIILVRTKNFSSSLQQKIDTAMELGNILIIDLFYDYPLTSTDKIRQRLQYLTDIADHIMVGYCCKKGNIDQIISGKSNVTVMADERPLIQNEKSAASFQFPNRGATIQMRLTDGETDSKFIIEQINYKGKGIFKKDQIIFQRTELSEFKQSVDLILEMDKLHSKHDEKQKQKLRSERYKQMIVNQRKTYPKAFMPWEKEEVEELKRLYEDQNLDINEISEQIGRSEKAVSLRLKLIYEDKEEDNTESA